MASKINSWAPLPAGNGVTFSLNVGDYCGMKIIEVRPSKKFKGAWEASECSGVQPPFAQPDAKAKALSYTRQRFGGSAGEIHVYDETGENIVEKISIDGGIQYGQPQR